MMESSETSSGSDEFYPSVNRSAKEGSTTVTLLGKTKTLAGLDWKEWIFFLLSVSCILATVGLTVEAMVKIIKTDSVDYVFAILILINAGFCLFYTIHGVLREREFELYCLITAIFILTLYVVVDFGVHFPAVGNVKKARFILIVILAPFIVGFAWVVGQGFGFLEFRTVGAGAEIQAMYRAASRFSGLLKFDYQLTVFLLVLTVEDCSNMSYFSKCSIAAGIPLQLLTAIIGWISMQTEQLLLVWLFLLLCFAEPIYIGFTISQFVERWKHFTSNEIQKLTYSFIALASCAIIVRILLLFALYIVVRNFGRGLKFKVFQLPVNDSDPPVLRSKRDIKKCCGLVCCGPIG